MNIIVHAVKHCAYLLARHGWMLGLDGSSYPDCLPEIPDVGADALTAAVGGVVALCRPQRVGPHLGRRLGTLPERPRLPQLSALLENDNQSCTDILIWQGLVTQTISTAYSGVENMWW